MKYISTIVKENKAAVKKKVKSAPKAKPILIIYKGKAPLCESLLFACLPEDEEELLKQIGEEMSDKQSYKRVVITAKDKSSEGWLLAVKSNRPSLVMF